MALRQRYLEQKHTQSASHIQYEEFRKETPEAVSPHINQEVCNTLLLQTARSMLDSWSTLPDDLGVLGRSNILSALPRKEILHAALGWRPKRFQGVGVYTKPPPHVVQDSRQKTKVVAWKDNPVF